MWAISVCPATSWEAPQAGVTSDTVPYLVLPIPFWLASAIHYQWKVYPLVLGYLVYSYQYQDRS